MVEEAAQKMEQVKISDFLVDFNKISHQGKCKSCQKSVQWSTASLSAHKRSSCPTATNEEKRKFAKRKRSNIFKNSASGEDSDQDLTNPISIGSDEGTSGTNEKLASFFFRTGISLRVADSFVFKDLVKSLNPVYAESMPTSKKLSGPLLDQQYQKCSQILEEILDQSTNLTLISDGWTNVRGDHIVNFCVKSPGAKPFFHSSIDTSGIPQNAQAVADEILKVIEKLGSEKFCCLVTDNAPVMKAAWRIIEQKFPHITAMGCAAHALNLLIKDTLDTSENTKLIKEAEKIIKFSNNHHIVKSKYEELRKTANIPHTLTMAVATRWFSRFTSLRDLSASKYVLIQLVDEEGEALQEIQPKSTSAAVIKIIKTDQFWDSLSKIVKIIEFPANIIGMFHKYISAL